MSEGEDAGTEPDPAAPSRRGAVDPATLLLAVERVGAEVVALGRALASQPEEVAARLDVDAATASIGVRVGALGSALDQFRLSLLAALDRTSERLDEPVWLPWLRAAIAELEPKLDRPPWLADLRAALADRPTRPELPPSPGLEAALADVGPQLDAPRWLPELREALARLDPTVEGHDELRQVIAQLARVEQSLGELRGWAPSLEALAGLGLDRRLDELTITVDRGADADRLAGLTTAVARIAEDDRLDAVLSAVESAAPGERLAGLEQAVAELSDGVRAGAAVADALDHLGERLAAIEDAAGRVAEDARVLVERVSPVPDRLSAIASQVDRITPLARAGDQAGSLFDQLDRVGAGLDAVITLLRARSEGSSGTGGMGENADEDERFEAVVDVLAGVTRRQDQVTAAIASVLEQVRGPKGVDAVLERVEQRERSLAARLDRIDAELRRPGAPPGSSASAEPRADAEAARALEAVTAMVDQQERLLGFRLDQIDAELRRLSEATAAAPQDQPGPEAERLLGSVLARVERQEATMARHLDWVGERLAEVAAHLVPEPPSTEDAGGQQDAPSGGDDDARFEALGDVLSAVARRQDELAAAIASLVDQVRGPTAVDVVVDRMEQRERSLAARLDRIDHQLGRYPDAGTGREGLAGAPMGSPQPADSAAASLGASVEAIATVAEDLASLVESTADRLDRRLSRVEAALGGTAPAATSPALPVGPAPPSASTAAAALRLAQLRAERADVQAQIEEERLLAARSWDDEL